MVKEVVEVINWSMVSALASGFTALFVLAVFAYMFLRRLGIARAEKENQELTRVQREYRDRV